MNQLIRRMDYLDFDDEFAEDADREYKLPMFLSLVAFGIPLWVMIFLTLHWLYTLLLLR